MIELWKEILKNLSEWLTFATTFLLGCMTAYFAWRTRQLERQQLRQINREFDRELADAEAELNRGTVAWHYWQSWRQDGNWSRAFQTYAMTRADIVKPDLPKLQRILAFHLPAEEERASSAVIKIHAALAALDYTLQSRPHLGEQVVQEQVLRAEQGLSEAAGELRRTLDTISDRRKRLRR